MTYNPVGTDSGTTWCGQYISAPTVIGGSITTKYAFVTENGTTTYDGCVTK